MMVMMVVILMIVFHLQNVDEVICFAGVPWQLKEEKFKQNYFFSLFFFYFLNKNFSKCVASLLLQNYGSMVPVMERY